MFIARTMAEKALTKKALKLMHRSCKAELANTKRFLLSIISSPGLLGIRQRKGESVPYEAMVSVLTLTIQG
jgi:hypothetical protein